MRITIINQFYRPDVAPTAQLAASFAEHRASLGDSVTVIAGKGAYSAEARKVQGPDSAVSANPRVRRVWTPGLGKSTNLKRVIDYAAFYVFAAWRMLTLPRQDVIIALTTPPIIAWTARLHKLLHRHTKVILWCMDCYPDLAERSGVIRTNGLVARLARGRNRAIFRNLAHLVCLDSAMANLLCEQYARVKPGLPVTIVPNWEDLSFFPEMTDPGQSALIEKLGIRGRFVVLYLGNMGYGHTFGTALDAADRLRDDPITFLFVGGGRRANEIREAAAERGLSNVVVHDYISKDQTGPLMAHAGCALVTLRDEIIGIMSPSKIHANMAMGLPLLYIGPETSNVDEAISAYGVGLSARHGDIDGVVGFIRRMAADGAERTRLRTLARAAFESGFCDKAAHPKFDEVIAHAVSGARTSRVPTGTAADYARTQAAPRESVPAAARPQEVA